MKLVMIRHTLAAFLLGAALPAAAATLSANTHPTAVTHARIEISGHVLPSMHQQLVMYTRDDRRINDYQVHMDSWWARLLMRHAAHSADLFRLDRGQAYKLLFDRQQYYQCRVAGCPSVWNLIKRFAKHFQSQSSTYDPQGNQSCPLTLTHHGLSVRDTGKTQTVDGYTAHRYRATFTVVFQDANARKDTNTLKLDVWTTPPTGTVRKVWAIDQQATDRYLKEASAHPNPLAQYLPRDIFHALGVFTGNIDGKAQTWHQQITRQLATIQGFPVAVELNWYVDSKACPATTTASASSADDNGGGGVASAVHNPFGALRGMIGHAVAKHVEKDISRHFEPKPDSPVLHYRRDITGMTIEPVADSRFEVPAGFTRKPLPDIAKSH